MLSKYNVIVVGAGHAGCEAAAAAATLGSKVLLITMDMNKIAAMSCNPAVGGIAKGQIVREIDALGGFMGLVTDASMIQFRMLNKSKGPAMWSPRAQCDRVLFSLKWRDVLEANKNVDFWQDTVSSLIFEKDVVVGVKTKTNIEIFADTVVLTNGTFLNGLMHIGRNKQDGGRHADQSSYGLSDQLLNQYNFVVGRMKTGTPARLDGRTIDFSKCIEQPGDDEIRSFSYLPESKMILPQKSCWLTYTSSAVHDILKTGFDESPLFNGTIQSIGPRYCPSIETKLETFASKDKHQLFLEPEGANTIEYYINGFSSSLPAEVQYEALKQVSGLENVKIFRPGYAIEYDYFDPTQLNATLETKKIKNLFFAGQINGTTGYEEAAAQGIIAGINAHQNSKSLEPFTLSRDEAYIGVLIDDLITKGVNEPYRMFTSRAEYRILLRQDNADVRLTEKAYRLGLADEHRYISYKKKYDLIDSIKSKIVEISIKPEDANPILEALESSPVKQMVKLKSILTRPSVQFLNFIKLYPELEKSIYSHEQLPEIILESIDVDFKYSGYIEKEKAIAEKILRLENLKIKDRIDYATLHSLSTEARQKLSLIQPETIGQASRISGVSPSDLNVLLLFMGR